MSKIGILTFLHNGNYGSSLQAFALQKVIREMGYDCEHIDYQPDVREKVLNMIRCRNHPKLLLDGKKKKQVRISQTGMQEKMKRILTFYGTRMNLSPRCCNHKELRAVSARYDILICGSDQIWNPIWMNPAYFLDFAEPEKTRIAYAPSLGIREVPGRRKQRIIRRWTALFDAVSVREEEGARMMVSMTGNRPPVMPDPVCLLSKVEWERILVPVKRDRPYLLCYFIGENTAYWEKVRKLSEQTGLKALVIPVTSESYGLKDFDLLDGAGPEEFLGAVSNADLICTDSFHGTAFGTIFQKKVELIRRDSDQSRDSKNSRVDHFLREIQNKGLEKMRKEGIDWLRQSLTAKDIE